jgi:copper homeostasis protein (lipoprotein)
MILSLAFLLISGGAFAMDVVTGTAGYRERIAMGPGVLFEARIEDVSRADALSVVIGSVRIEDTGNPPYAFAIEYNAAAIIDTHTYAVRASLSKDGALLFTTDTIVPVLTRDAPNSVNLTMVPASSHAEASPVPAHGLSLPATFMGDLPCADCEAIRHHLDLWPDQVFHLRREWIGGEEPLVEDALGHWSVDPSRMALILHDSGADLLEFAITGPATLRLLDREGQPIVSELPYDLTTDGRLKPTDISARMIGEFVYFADAARFVECGSVRDFPVAQEGDYLALERAYLDQRAEPLAPLVAVIDGTITLRDGMEGGVRPTVVVDRFSNVWPGLTCERARTNASLRNTYWRIAQLDDMQIRVTEGAREPHIILRAGEDAFAATVGCNQVLGGVAQVGQSLTLSPGPMTMMACPAPLDAYEQRLVHVLQRVAGYAITGPTMELRDADGAVIAQLEAVYLP